jgi:hypothetical protein
MRAGEPLMFRSPCSFDPLPMKPAMPSPAMIVVALSRNGVLASSAARFSESRFVLSARVAGGPSGFQRYTGPRCSTHFPRSFPAKRALKSSRVVALT